MGLSYEYSIGSVRAKEISLLTQQDIDRIAAMKSAAELRRYLQDKGFGEGGTPEEILSAYLEQTWDYIRGVAPDFCVFYPFLYQNDVHNLKTALKGTLSGRVYRHLLLKPYTIEPDTIIHAVENDTCSQLPEWLGAPAEKAYQILSHTVDARLSDAVLDTALLHKILDEAESSNSDFLSQYFQIYAFYCNVKVALRASRIHGNADFLDTALCDCPKLLKEELKAAALKGEKAVLELLSKKEMFESGKAAEAYLQSPMAFEKFVDNYLIKLAKAACKRASEGPDPLFGYLIAVMAQNKAVHIAAVGIRTGTPPEVIKERLREVYG